MRIISLSLGASRTFELVSKAKLFKAQKKFRFASKSAAVADITQVELNQGDVVVMAGRMQSYYDHRVPPDTTMEPRINLTWRYLTQHSAGCLNR